MSDQPECEHWMSFDLATCVVCHKTFEELFGKRRPSVVVEPRALTDFEIREARTLAQHRQISRVIEPGWLLLEAIKEKERTGNRVVGGMPVESCEGTAPVFGPPLTPSGDDGHRKVGVAGVVPSHDPTAWLTASDLRAVCAEGDRPTLVAFLDALLAQRDRVNEEAEGLRMQLEGCGVAALGYVQHLSPESPGWSNAYQDVVDRNHQYDQDRADLLAKLAAANTTIAELEAELVRFRKPDELWLRGREPR